MKKNTKEESNGYVVFKLNFDRSAGKEDGGGVTPPAPHLFLQQDQDRIFKDDMNGLPSTWDICFRFTLLEVFEVHALTVNLNFDGRQRR
jgi:hypothetical protein